jgi:hypothetical protein
MVVQWYHDLYYTLNAPGSIIKSLCPPRFYPSSQMREEMNATAVASIVLYNRHIHHQEPPFYAIRCRKPSIHKKTPLMNAKPDVSHLGDEGQSSRGTDCLENNFIDAKHDGSTGNGAEQVRGQAAVHCYHAFFLPDDLEALNQASVFRSSVLQGSLAKSGTCNL